MIVAGILAEGEYGLVGIAISVPTLIEIMRDLGVDQATIKYSAQYKQKNDPEKIKSILSAAAYFEILMGAILSIVSFLLSGFISSEILNRPSITPLVQITSITIFGNGLFTVANSTFVGYGKMHYRSLTLIVQSIIKAILMIVLVLSNFGTFGAVTGHSLSIIIAGVIAIAIFYLKIYKKLTIKTNKLKIKETLKNMFEYGLPISASTMMNTFMNQFYIIIMAVYLSDAIVGNYNLAINFSILVSFFIVPLQIILFPTFSKIDGKKEPETLKTAFRESAKFGSLLIIPAAFMVMSLSEPAVSTLFPGKYLETPLYLSLYLILFLYSAFGRLTNPNLINSQGNTKLHLKLNILNNILALVLALILIPTFGVLGLIATILLSYLPYLIISSWWIKKTFNATINYKSSIKIMSVSALSGILTYTIISLLPFSSVIRLIVGALIFFISYLIFAPLLGAINVADINALKEMTESLGPLYAILEIPLNLIKKIAKIRK